MILCWDACASNITPVTSKESKRHKIFSRLIRRRLKSMYVYTEILYFSDGTMKQQIGLVWGARLYLQELLQCHRSDFRRLKIVLRLVNVFGEECSRCVFFKFDAATLFTVMLKICRRASYEVVYASAATRGRVLHGLRLSFLHKGIPLWKLPQKASNLSCGKS